MEKRYVPVVELLRQIREDWKAHGYDWTEPGFRAVAVHRFGFWLSHGRSSVIKRVMSRFYRMMFRYVRNHYGIELPGTTKVGRRFVIGHQGGIVIHYYSVIGDDCLIRQNVTIGAASHDRPFDAPKLGHRVQVGCGAAILGNVTIGDGARIGPNAVVMTNVPAGATVFAPPSRIIQAPQSQKVARER